MHNFVVFDIETGGLDFKVNPITQIALVVLDGTTLQELETFSTYIKPYKSDLDYDQKALTYTNITMEMLRSKGIAVSDVHKKCVEIFRKYKLPGRAGNSKMYPVCVGHNASEFDRKFLWQLFKDHNDDLYNYVRAYFEDTMLLSQNAVPSLSSVKLGNCCEHFGISLEGAHDALNDTRSTAELFKVLTKRLRGGDGDEEVISSSTNQYKRTLKFEWE